MTNNGKLNKKINTKKFNSELTITIKNGSINKKGGKIMRLDRVKLILLIAEKDLTLTKLSELSGVSRQTLSCVKQGKRCALETANKIARALNVDVREIAEVKK